MSYSNIVCYIIRHTWFTLSASPRFLLLLPLLMCQPCYKPDLQALIQFTHPRLYLTNISRLQNCPFFRRKGIFLSSSAEFSVSFCQQCIILRCPIKHRKHRSDGTNLILGDFNHRIKRWVGGIIIAQSEESAGTTVTLRILG